MDLRAAFRCLQRLRLLSSKPTLPAVVSIGSLKNAITDEFVGRYGATQGNEGMTFFSEIRAHKWIAARALMTGWGLWILSLVWFFPFISRYFFIYKVPKPYPVTSPFASPDFFGRGLGVSFSLSEPIASAASVMWMPIAAPRGINEDGLASANTFMFGIVLPFIVAAVCGWVVARFHRKQQRAAVLLFAGSMLLMNLLLFARHVAIVGARVAYAFVGPLSFYVLASVMGILLGGELLRLSSKRENREGRTAD